MHLSILCFSSSLCSEIHHWRTFERRCECEWTQTRKMELTSESFILKGNSKMNGTENKWIRQLIRCDIFCYLSSGSLKANVETRNISRKSWKDNFSKLKLHWTSSFSITFVTLGNLKEYYIHFIYHLISCNK